MRLNFGKPRNSLDHQTTMTVRSYDHLLINAESDSRLIMMMPMMVIFDLIQIQIRGAI